MSSRGVHARAFVGTPVSRQVLAAGGVSRLSVFDDVVHGWQLLAPLVPEARAAQQELASFVAQSLSSRDVRP